MRIRRIRSKIPLTERKPFRTTTDVLDSVGPDVTRLQLQQPFVRPTASSPLHPNSSRYPIGLYKYSTGQIPMRRAWLRALALKIYSREPVQKPEILRALSTTLESSSATGGLATYLKTVFDIAFKVASTSRKIQDVLVQGFGRSADRNDNKLLLKHSARRWNLACQLYRHPDADASPSKAYVELNVPEFHIEGLCKVQDTSLIVALLQVSVGFHLKPEFVEADEAIVVADSAKSRPIQAVADGILEAERQSIADKVFADAGEIALTVKDAVLEYLRLSTLTHLVDFHHVEIAACSRRYQRSVVSTLLNADGSIKEPPIGHEHGLEAFVPPLAGGSTFSHASNDTSEALLSATDGDSKTELVKLKAGGKGVDPLSRVTRDKTGLKSIRNVEIFPVSKVSQNNLELSPVHLIKQFDGFSETTQLTGLACIAYATAQLAAKMHDTSAIIELSDRYGHSFRAHMNDRKGRGFSGIHTQIRIPALSGLKLSLDGSPSGFSYLDSCNVSLYGKHRQESAAMTGSNPNFQISTENELDILTRMTNHVVKGILSEVHFESYDAMPQLLAEGVLRTLRFPSSSIILQGVRVTTILPEDSRFGHCEISAEEWRPFETAGAESGLDSEAGRSTSVAEVIEDARSEGSTQRPENNVHQINEADISPHLRLFSAPNVEHMACEQDSTSNGGIFIALGSNLGDRLQNIENACQELDSDEDIRIKRTSALYETAPMYVEEQDHFLNGVCEIETSLEPMALLDRLQAIEQRLGRVKMIEKGPRNIDLDILHYRNEKMETERLTIPHPLMLEREFVLRPLCDILSARGKQPDARSNSYLTLLKKLEKPEQPMQVFTELAPGRPQIRGNNPHAGTSIMSIVNVTPDSFSDGGKYDITDSEPLISSLQAQIAAGANIIDIGGQSSRPNAPNITAEEEISRVLPAIKTVRSMPEAANITISVDTYRAAVAEAAINAGANIINDISSGMLDPDMLSTIAKLQCTYIMMHMRGSPATMMSRENCTYSQGLIPMIADELAERVEAAQNAGIRRWRIILDPGIGFSKTPDQNVEILRKFPELKKWPTLRNFAWLIGSSRKSFIGKITGVEEPKNRGWGTAATVTAAIQGGADIVRVHDAEEMAAVVTMADAIYRV